MMKSPVAGRNATELPCVSRLAMLFFFFGAAVASRCSAHVLEVGLWVPPLTGFDQSAESPSLEASILNAVAS